jgi:ADP-heptose:LPS heptosyltransferase
LKDPERILVVRMSHLGDVVCALPLLHALREAHPAAEIGWVVQPEFAGLLAGMPGLQRTFLFGRRDGAAAWWRLARELRAFRPALAVDAQGNLKSAAALIASGAPRRIGLHPSEWRERTGARALTESAPPSGATHAIERALCLARFVAPGAAPRFDPDLQPRELDAARAELARLVGAAAPALLHLGRPGDPRAWPPTAFGALARLLGGAGRAVVLVSGPREEDAGLALARELGERAPRAGGAPALRHLVGQRDLRRLAALFAAAAESGGELVGVDSGPMHLACAVGLRATCLAGPQDERATGPWTAGGAAPERALRTLDPPDCAPCRRRRCDHPEGPVCMTRIRPEDVLAALAR